MTSLGDDARETLTIAGLEKAKERSLQQHLRLRAPQTWTVLRASVDQYLRSTVDSRSQPTPREIGAVMSTCALCGTAGHEKARCRFRNAKCSNCGKTGHLRAMCRQREKSAGKSSPSRSSGKSLAKAARAVETQTSAVVVDRSVIDDLIALVETRVAVYVAEVLKRMANRETPRPGQECPPSLSTLRRQPGLLGREFERDPPCAMSDPAWRVGGWTWARVWGENGPFHSVERICPCERLSVCRTSVFALFV